MPPKQGQAAQRAQGAHFPPNPVQKKPDKPKDPAKDDPVKKMFELLDKWGTGSIGARDLRLVMQALNIEPRDEELLALVASADTNRSGGIEMDEFRALMEHQVTEAELDQVCNAFKVFDTDRTGLIAAGELRRALTELANMLSHSEARPHALS
eukprot:tig00020960_g16590.t1